MQKSFYTKKINSQYMYFNKRETIMFSFLEFWKYKLTH